MSDVTYVITEYLTRGKKEETNVLRFAEFDDAKQYLQDVSHLMIDENDEWIAVKARVTMTDELAHGVTDKKFKSHLYHLIDAKHPKVCLPSSPRSSN